MLSSGSVFLLVSASLSLAAAVLHFACIPWGANGYRILGAGEPIVTWAAQGHWYPPLVAFFIGSVLSVWASYALSAAGFLRPLPFLKPVLVFITAIYILRAVAFPLLKPAFPGNSQTFWLISSAICLLVGVVHLVGIIQAWGHL